MTTHNVSGTGVSDRAFPEWQHRYVSSKPYPKGHIIAEAGLHYIRGNSLPYFSVTATIYEGRRDVSGGCLHREVAQYFPKLIPVIRLHLSDSLGVPMHPEANGWYWLAGYYGGAGERYHGGNSEMQHWKADGEFDGYRHSAPDECLAVFADHVRVPIEIARALAREWQTGIPYPEAKAHFLLWARDQRARWKSEADEAIALLDRLNTLGEDKV